jgi:type II secretory pathway pseudopilin PulG
MSTHARKFRRGFIAFDVVMGMAILGIAAAVLVSAVSSSNRASRRLASSRQAAREAEAVLIALQVGEPVPKSNATIRVEPCTGGASIPGRHWVQVVATIGGQSRLLVGLVPDAPPAGGGK